MCRNMMRGVDRQPGKMSCPMFCWIVVVGFLMVACQSSTENPSPSSPAERATDGINYAHMPGGSVMVPVNGEQHQLNFVISAWPTYPYGSWIYAEINEQQGTDLPPGVNQVPINIREVVFTFSGLPEEATEVIVAIKDTATPEDAYLERGRQVVHQGTAVIPVAWEHLIHSFGITHYSIWFQVIGGKNGKGIASGTWIEMRGTLSDGQVIVLSNAIQFGTAPVSTGDTLPAPPCGGPIVSSPIPDQAASNAAGWVYTFPANTFTDTCGTGSLTYLVSNAPAWLNFDAGARTFDFTPNSATMGVYSGIEVTATDGNGDSVSDEFRLTVTP